MSESICGYCASGQPDFCSNPQEVTVNEAEGYFIPCGVAFAPVEKTTGIAGQRGRPVASPLELTNDVSAGRKRAAMLAPIMTGMPCEWAGLKFAGGGVHPIMGCRSTTIAQVKRTEEALAVGAQDVGHIHHGPDKAVLNNAVGVNLHRVCSTCHNRWHAWNDPEYEGLRPTQDRPWTPSSPYLEHDAFTTWTDEEKAADDAWWALPKSDRGPHPFPPPETARRKQPLDMTTRPPVGSKTDPFA